ncbi:hypothetical protein CEXT_500081 [Caerostris extrusa]|uniref:Uncharacterized protein n=1 Tax=Caerostris extrusa TaxID=172846 RepID=A0AAV4YAQ2_CAEEX|nr:hypothetical protein CEXT_500081 [Caerostris extrusa]
MHFGRRNLKKNDFRLKISLETMNSQSCAWPARNNSGGGETLLVLCLRIVRKFNMFWKREAQKRKCIVVVVVVCGVHFSYCCKKCRKCE